MLESALNPQAGKAQWIWYPGDFEMMLLLRVHSRRYERGMQITPCWHMDTFFPNIKFRRRFHLEKPVVFQVHATGEVAVEVDGGGRYYYDYQDGVRLEPGSHDLCITVFNPHELPALYIDADGLQTNGAWEASNVDSRWLPAGSWNFTSPSCPPSDFRLEMQPLQPVSVEKIGQGVLFDFGKEMMASLKGEGFKGEGILHISYGESREEALNYAECEVREDVKVTEDCFETTLPRAFRFVFLAPEGGLSAGGLTALYEYLPIENKGSFECSDDLLNRIYDTAVYTLHLNSREFFFDGIKRDRWVWGGDACQSYLLNYYSFFDSELCKRTMRALRGKDPVHQHHNTIQDYTCYWFISLYDYYLYTGDAAFLREVYRNARTLMDFCLETTDERGFMNARPEDWVFVDWAPINNKGDVSLIQILFARSLEVMALIAGLCGDENGRAFYHSLWQKCLKNCFEIFWSARYNCFTHGPAAASDAVVTKYANMFALSFGYLSEEQKAAVIQNALLNETVLPITTPYMRFYELAALCDAGCYEDVMGFLREYWGGMLRLGATSFWEAYDAAEQGAQHYAMYGRPFGKSLCHAWGAGPILLAGKYFLGVRPEAPGYEKFTVSPHLAGLAYIRGSVPTPGGTIDVFCDGEKAEVVNHTPFEGALEWKGQAVAVPPGQTVSLG